MMRRIRLVLFLLTGLVVAFFFLPVVRVSETRYIYPDGNDQLEAWAYGTWREGFLHDETASPYELFIVAPPGSDMTIEVKSGTGADITSSSAEGSEREDGKMVFILREMHLTPADTTLQVKCFSSDGEPLLIKMQREENVRTVPLFFYYVSGV